MRQRKCDDCELTGFLSLSLFNNLLGLTAATLAEAMKKKIKLEVMNSYHGNNNHGTDSENGDITSSMGKCQFLS